MKCWCVSSLYLSQPDGAIIRQLPIGTSSHPNPIRTRAQVSSYMELPSGLPTCHCCEAVHMGSNKASCMRNGWVYPPIHGLKGSMRGRLAVDVICLGSLMHGAHIRFTHLSWLYTSHPGLDRLQWLGQLNVHCRR
jgi:hypothetical protein